ncbi:hypothetical protein Lp16_D027 (plasmid) [Lactiplantibacillus plantarum 16]|nr:hypothetical protein Lp16_D027 [Lactiplantibacillus plantarum 16]
MYLLLFKQAFMVAKLSTYLHIYMYSCILVYIYFCIFVYLSTCRRLIICAI